MFKLANIITSLNLIAGVFAILFAFMGRIDIAPLMIFAGALFDFFDGFVARKLKQQGEMGKQLDSLADMVTFGVAPGIIMMVVMSMSVHSFVRTPYYEVVHYDFIIHLESLLNGSWNDFTPFITLFIPFFALFRLAKFNAKQIVLLDCLHQRRHCFSCHSRWFLLIRNLHLNLC
jgi:CDP-diacylglycerol--serine O-phosphatidyltransferase